MLSTKPDRLYLAYGMNTNGLQMSRRCPNAISLGKIVIPNYRLVFRHHADVEKDAKSKLQCVLWYISEDCEHKLDMLEGYPDYYVKDVIPVTYRGKSHRAMIYTMTYPDGFDKPSIEYVNLLEHGYREHGLDLNQIYDAPGLDTEDENDYEN